MATKFKFLGLQWDLTPIYVLFGCIWMGFLMFGGMGMDEDTPSWFVMFYFTSVILTLALTPTIDKLMGDKEEDK